MEFNSDYARMQGIFGETLTRDVEEDENEESMVKMRVSSTEEGSGVEGKRQEPNQKTSFIWKCVMIFTIVHADK